jgi:hypothetical protein
MPWTAEETHTPTATKWTNPELVDVVIVETRSPDRVESRWHVFDNQRTDRAFVNSVDSMTIADAAGIAKHLR